MTRMASILIVGVALAAGAATFVATVYSNGRPEDDGRCPLGEWLGLAVDQCKDVCRADPAFRKEAGELTAQVEEARETLASLLEDPATPEGPINEQVEKVIAANAALERRIVRHLLIIRPHLTRPQQERLMRLCAEGIRQGGQWRGQDAAGPNSGCQGACKASCAGTHGDSSAR